MSISQQNPPGNPGEDKISGGNFGNASNPSPHSREPDQNSKNQLLDEKAEKYIREAGNIEDLPDPQEQKEADEFIKKQSRNNG